MSSIDTEYCFHIEINIAVEFSLFSCYRATCKTVKRNIIGHGVINQQICSLQFV